MEEKKKVEKEENLDLTEKKHTRLRKQISLVVKRRRGGSKCKKNKKEKKNVVM